jgi:chromosome segregation ATPase
MTDIVERLREVTSQTIAGECFEAADEIERLRKERDNAFATWEKFHRDTLAAFIANEHEPLKAEIERLEKLVTHWREARRGCIEAGNMMREEIERLHNSQNEMLAVQSNQAFYLREKNAEIERLRGELRKVSNERSRELPIDDTYYEIERLRATLLTIRDWADERDYQGIVEKISGVLGDE